MRTPFRKFTAFVSASGFLMASLHAPQAEAGVMSCDNITTQCSNAPKIPEPTSDTLGDALNKAIDQGAGPLGGGLGQYISGSTNSGDVKLGGEIGSGFGKLLDHFLGTSFFSPVFDFLGSFIGGLFGYRGKPFAEAWVEYSPTSHSFVVTQSGVDNNGNRQVALTMASQVASAMDSVLAATGGTVVGQTPIFGFGYRKKSFFWQVSPQVPNSPLNFSGDAATAENLGVIAFLKDLTIQGVDPAILSAIGNSHASTVMQLGDDIVASLETEHLAELANLETPDLQSDQTHGGDALPSPEPGTLMLFGASLLGIAAARRRFA